jgi:hypothetical protein
MSTACLDPDTVLGWLDGQLSVRRAGALEAHIDGCSACRQLVSEAASAALDAEGPPGAPDQPDRLGPYEVRGVVGRGGMGEVYRAYDPRLDREVAVKVIRPAGRARLSADDLAWFEHEARAAAAIAHPNVVAVFDVGHHGGAPYVVTELLGGETLRARLKRGPIAPRQAIPWARELAHGMAAAHDRGIVHRDLKPENVFLTADGRVKILDFGVAAVLGRSDAGERSGLDAPGLVVGTIGYMAPEQLRGEPVDHRTDVFAFGAVLFEMITGAPAFRAAGDGDLELAEAALEQDPIEANADALAGAPWSMVQVMRRCLEKQPADRFQSARDLAFALDVVGTDATGRPSRARAATAATAGRGRRVAALVAGAVVLAAGAAAIGWAVRGRARTVAPGPPPAAPPASATVTPLDLREGRVLAARFDTDGASVLATATYAPSDPLLGLPAGARILRRDPGDLELGPSELPADRALVAVSRTAGIATLRGPQGSLFGAISGELVVIRPDGTELATGATDVEAADFLSDGGLVVIRRAAHWQLESPPGTKLHGEVGAQLFAVRASPAGHLAFLQRSMLDDGATRVMRLDKGGSVRVAATLHASSGLAWATDGDTLLVSGQERGVEGVFRIDARGGVELAWASPDPVVLYDVAPDGAFLVGVRSDGIRSYARAKAARSDTDITWREAANVVDMSADGRRVVQLALGAATGWRPVIYVCDPYGGGGVRIDDAVGGALSRDGGKLLVRTAERPWRLMIYTLDGSAAPLALEPAPLDDVSAAGWISGDEIAVLGTDTANRAVLFRQKVGAAAIEVGTWPLSWSGYRRFVPMHDVAPSLGPGPRAWRWFRISPDGARVADVDSGGEAWIVELATLKAARVPNTQAFDFVVGWRDHGKAVIVSRASSDGLTVSFDELDLATGARKLHHTITQRLDATTLGLIRIGGDAQAIAFSTVHATTRLFRVDGVAGARR